MIALISGGNSRIFLEGICGLVSEETFSKVPEKQSVLVFVETLGREFPEMDLEKILEELPEELPEEFPED